MLDENSVLDRFSSKLAQLLSYFAALGIFSLMSIVFVSVFFRYVLNTPIVAAEDLMALLLGMTIFTAYPAVTLSRAHIKVDLLTGVFEKHARLNRIRLIAVDCFVIAMTSFMALRLWQQATRYEKRETLSNTMEWPLFPFVFSFSILLSLAVLLFAYRAYRDRGLAGQNAEELSQ